MSPQTELPSLLAVPELLTLLAELRRAAASAQPERELTRLLAERTGGRAEIRASWGDLVAASGTGPPGAEGQSFRLVHGKRHVGGLTLWTVPEWQALGPLAAEYALLARLQTAAAGAARRRVGERTLDALLSGQGDVGTLGEEPYALAAATFTQGPGTGASARAAHAHALDVLAGAGEGYFAERGARGLCTVQGDRALWLWPAADPAREGQELFAALLASTGRAVRLGVSARHHGAELGSAFAEARQALAAVRGEAGVQVFQELDPLYALLGSGELRTLRAQVLARLAALEDSGRTEATLRAYLAHRGTLAELAEKQHLHVNTLRYRLRRAEEALGGSMDDPALLARLYLAFEAG